MMGTDGNIRGVQFTWATLARVDELCRRRGLSRSELLRQLIDREYAADGQAGLPGFDVGVPAGGGAGSMLVTTPKGKRR